MSKIAKATDAETDRALGVLEEAVAALAGRDDGDLEHRALSALLEVRDAVNPEMVGSVEACKILGVPYKQRGNLRKIAGLPDPYQKLSRGWIWKKVRINEFAHARRAGRVKRPSV